MCRARTTHHYVSFALAALFTAWTLGGAVDGAEVGVYYPAQVGVAGLQECKSLDTPDATIIALAPYVGVYEPVGYEGCKPVICTDGKGAYGVASVKSGDAAEWTENKKCYTEHNLLDGYEKYGCLCAGPTPAGASCGDTQFLTCFKTDDVKTLGNSATRARGLEFTLHWPMVLGASLFAAFIAHITAPPVYRP